MPENAILTDVREGVLVATFNRPERMNAMSFDVMVPFREAIDAAAADNVVENAAGGATGRLNFVTTTENVPFTASIESTTCGTAPFPLFQVHLPFLPFQPGSPAGMSILKGFPALPNDTKSADAVGS